MELTPVEAERYVRHLSIPALGPAGQARIRDARVHVVGAGAAAGPALLCLAQAGVGALFVDDGDDVAAEDEGAWLYTPDLVGEPRLLAALEPVRRASSLVRVRPHATGSEASATLIFPSSRGVALLASDRARLASQPHVVAVVFGDGGRVVSVPLGAPCFRCAGRSATGARPAPGASAVVGLLGALELLLIVSGLIKGPDGGRCIDLGPGRPQVRAMVRRGRCDCSNVY